jgi:NADH-quinone oxidoreductase subunit C
VTFVGPDVRTGHVVQLARARFGGAALARAEAHAREDVVGVGRELLLDLLAFLRDDRDLSLGLLLDLTCVDGGEGHEPRFTVVYRLKSPRLGYRARVLVQVPEHDAVVPSVTPLFPAADWYERELWDLFGVYPDGHPHLRRLLLYPGFIGHPLRRDYPAGKAQPLVPTRSSAMAAPAPSIEEGDG